VTQPFEPYAPPRAAPPTPEPSGAPGQALSWSPTEVLGLAWARFKRSWFVLVAGYVVVTVISQLVSSGPALAAALGSHGADKAQPGLLVQSAGFVVSMGVSSFLMVGFLRVCLGTARARPPSFGTLFFGGDRFLPMLALYFLMTLAMFGGLLLLIVPGIIVALGLSFAPLYLVDDSSLSPVGAMRASWAATKGQRGKILGFALLNFALMMLGALACGIGIFVSVSVGYVAWAIVYTRISGRAGALPDPAPGMQG
jgi:uncharacterized membrane protein